MAEKYPSLLPETYAKVMEISSKLSKNCKSVNDRILLKAVKPRTEILKVNGMDKKPAKVQADILYESTKALNELVVQTRCREVHKIKESIKKNSKVSRAVKENTGTCAGFVLTLTLLTLSYKGIFKKEKKLEEMNKKEVDDFLEEKKKNLDQFFVGRYDRASQEVKSLFTFAYCDAPLPWLKKSASQAAKISMSKNTSVISAALTAL